MSASNHQIKIARGRVEKVKRRTLYPCMRCVCQEITAQQHIGSQHSVDIAEILHKLVKEFL